jgi:hypothetical protein
VIYFFLWTAALGLAAADFDDPGGLQLLFRSARKQLQALDPSNPINFHFSLTIGGERAVHIFQWNGIDWTVPVLLSRLLWIAAAIALAFLASVFFNRFDPARSWRRQRTETASQPETASREPISPQPMPIAAALLTPLPLASASSRFPQLVISELRLMLKGQRWWWYAGAAGLLVGQIVPPDPGTRSGFLIAAWIWPILLWSQMGCREARHSTTALLFSSERSLSRQLPALWIAGVLLALLTGGGVAIRLLLSADWHSFAAWLAATVFIPSLALVLGIWSGSRKAFEAIYTVWWYIGPAHQIPGLDFMGTTPASSSPLAYALAAFVLLSTAYWGRRIRLGYA